MCGCYIALSSLCSIALISPVTERRMTPTALPAPSRTFAARQVLAIFFRQYCRRVRGLQGKASSLLLNASRGVSVRGGACLAREVGGCVFCSRTYTTDVGYWQGWRVPVLIFSSFTSTTPLPTPELKRKQQQSGVPKVLSFPVSLSGSSMTSNTYAASWYV